MPKLSRKEFAELCGKQPDYIGIYVRRGGLVEVNKLLDTSNLKNKAFIEKNIDKTEFIKSETKKESSDSDNSSDKKVTLGNIDYILKQHDLKLKNVKIKRESLELDKRKAKVLPLDFVIDWSALNIRGVFGETVNFGNSMIEQICNELDADINIKLKYKKQFKQGFNEILKAGIDNQKPEAIAQAKEYSLTTKW